MTQPRNFFDQFDGHAPVVLTPPGDPIIAGPDPYKQASEQRAREDQIRQEEAARIARENADRAARKETRDVAEFQGQGGKPTEFQSKSASFYGRMLRAEQGFNAVPEADRGPRGIIRQAVHEYAPGMENTYLNTSDRQISDQDALDFVRASLRQESGASINADEEVKQYRLFFPMPGDGADVLKQKAEARRVAIEGFKIAAGPEAAKMAAQINPAGAAVTTNNPEVRTQLETKLRSGVPLAEINDYLAKQNSSPISEAKYRETRDYLHANPHGPLAVSALLQTPGGNGPDDPGGITVNQDTKRAALDAELTNRGYTPSVGNLIASGLFQSGADELAGVGGGLHDLVRGGSFSGGYTRERDLADRATQQARDAYGTAGSAIEFASSLPTLALGGGEIAAGRAGLAGAAKLGTAQAALIGFNEGRGLNQSAGNALIATPLGAAAGAGGHLAAPYVANALSAVGSRFARGAPADFNPALVEAGQRQGIPIRRPDAAPSLRGDMANTAQTSHGGPLVNSARNADAQAVEARVGEIGGQGAVQQPYGLGTTVQAAAERHIVRTRAQANRLYESARKLAGDTKVTPTNADAALDQHITELKAGGENSNAGAIKYLEGLRNDIDRGMGIESVQNLRSNMRGQLNERNLTGSDTERRVKDVIGAMNRDLADQLPKNASRALGAADKFYGERMDFIKQVSQKFIGQRGNPVSAETAAGRLLSMVNGKGDEARFARMFGELEPGEQADLGATVAASLGRKANGEFSLSTLVRSLHPAKGINPRTARLVFGSNGAKALNDLRLIASEKTATQQAMNNSNTGATVTRAAGGMKSLLLGAFGFSTGGVTGMVAAPLAQGFMSKLGEQRAARLLLNPDFTKWLRNAPNTANPKAIDAYITRLAATLPANDNLAFTGALRDAFSKSPGAAAAQQEPDARREPPQ